MLMAFLTTRLGKFAFGALAVVLAIAGFMWWLNARENAAVERDRAEAAVEVLGKARRADEVAGATTDAIQTKLETENADARKAAAGSDDPLARGFDSLRGRKAGSGAPARKPD